MPNDQFGDQIAVPLPFAIAMGAFNASASTLFQGHRTGYVAAATLNTNVNLRPGTFAQQSSQAQRSIVSTSVNDTAAGTGAQTVTINYLTNAMVLKSETVSLNGTSAVNMVATDVQFIESMVVATTGNTFVNAGDISLKTTTGGGGSTMAQILTGDNSTFYCHHYVAPGVTCYIIKHTGSATLAAGRSLLVTFGDPRSTNLPIQQIGDIFCHLAGGSDDHEYESPLLVVGPNLIVARENPIASAAGNLAYGGFDYVEF